MSKMTKFTLGAIAAAAALSGGIGAAFAAEEEKPKFTYSFNVGATTDYVFRGVAQNKKDPSLQGGIDLTYQVLPTVAAYFGVWASNVDFGANLDGTRVAGAEVDIYGGIRPTWGPATFDLGVIWYTYPGSRDAGPPNFQVEQQNYVELKAGVSGAFIPGLDKLTTGATIYYSPEYQGGQGEVVTIEGTAAYELPKVWVFVPTVSGTFGAQFGSDAKNFYGPNGVFNNGPLHGFALANGENELTYWNVGITLALDKLSFDFRYWGNDIKDFNRTGGTTTPGFCTGRVLQCDDQYVFTAKFTY